jgi:hypothetical protein
LTPVEFWPERLACRGGKSQMSFWEAEGAAKYFLSKKYTFVTKTDIQKYKILRNKNIPTQN